MLGLKHYLSNLAMNTSYPTRLASYEKIKQSNFKAKVLSYITHQHVQPSYDEYLMLNQALQSGDAPMDELLSWIMQNPKLHRRYFETALYQGLEQLPHEIPELSKFFHLVEQKPRWYDPQKMDDALQFIYRLGINNGLILRNVSLMAGYLYPGFNQPLILTGALKKQAAIRLGETTKWWIDITEPHGFERFSKGFTSTIFVRFIHSLVRHQLSKSEKWDAQTWGMPINQYDQAMTNIAFSSVVLLSSRALGVFPSRQEVDSFLHFWKYAGWLMGIEEKWLIDRESEGWKLMYWLPFAHPESDESSKILAKSLSKEPFEHSSAQVPLQQQKQLYRQHLDITQFFIGAKKMQRLGLKPRSVPWSAYTLFARNLVLYTGAKYSTKLNTSLIQQGRKLQKAGLDMYEHKGKRLASMH
jgi:hypothetical protein